MGKCLDDPKVNFESWAELRCRGDMKKGWISCFYVIIYCIWEPRNKVVFQNKSVCWQNFMMEMLHKWRIWNSSCIRWFKIM